MLEWSKAGKEGAFLGEDLDGGEQEDRSPMATRDFLSDPGQQVAA